MRILVIGGSYFFGRWFVQYAYKNHDVTVINRGNMPLGLKEITEWKADRHDLETLAVHKGEKFDCIVDFCAYETGDIKTIADIFDTNRYIFISTVDVYKKGSGEMLTEDSELEDRILPGDVGAYINGKVALEHELAECFGNSSTEYISVRPGLLYGPANYAPREAMYYQWITTAGQIIAPKNSDGSFQFIYVQDAAKALMEICRREEVFNAYNFVNRIPDTYESFHKALHMAVVEDFEEVMLEPADIIASEVPLPFPLTKSESETYGSERFDDLGIEITPLFEGLGKAFSVLG